ARGDKDRRFRHRASTFRNFGARSHVVARPRKRGLTARKRVNVRGPGRRIARNGRGPAHHAARLAHSEPPSYDPRRGIRRMTFRPAAACLALGLVACSNEPLPVAENVDLARFQGKWYEIAKLPRPTQANCTGTTAFYTFREGGLDVQNECHLDKLDGE